MDLAINKEGTRMVAICHSMKIHIYNLITKMEEEYVENFHIYRIYALLYTRLMEYLLSQTN